ncbi:MAG: molybdate ABC transporter substrate-binding protein [Fibromonadaceae bacterium]|jgi:molybdate transport system substrate-binding protein|nr:molybdate ABC transporter substrate-binding protein [Fibromonadaceae bacterium]
MTKNRVNFVKLFLTAVLALATFAMGAGEAKKSKEPFTLNVFAAASLTEALNEIATLYKAAVPEATLTFNFDSSGKLQTQIENGAEADLFLSAGQKQMDAIAAAYVDSTTRKDLLVNQVVLIVPKNSKKNIKSFEDCLGDKVSLIAIGNSSVPVGQYTEEIFKFLNGWDKITAKASLGTNVKEVLSQVESGSVDAGVVYLTDAATAKNVKVVTQAPKGSHKPTVYPAAVLKKSARSQEAKAFLDFLSTPKATAVFKKIGFEVVK